MASSAPASPGYAYVSDLYGWPLLLKLPLIE
jgi:hypothetical protein